MATQAKKGKVEIHGRFTPGTTVELHERGSADVYAGGTGGKVTQAKTDKNGVTTFDAPPGNYFAVATEKDWDHVAEKHVDRLRVVDVSIAPPPVPVAEQDAVLPSGPEPPAEGVLDNVEIIVGARSSADGNATVDRTILRDRKTGMVSEFATPVGQDQPKKDIPADGQAPAARIEDQPESTKLASSTLTGEAVPPQPQAPLQEDAPKSMKQASSTEEGVQAPAREVVRQEDVSGSTHQASATETGTSMIVDPEQPTRSGSGTGKMVPQGTSKPVRGTREPQAPSSSKRAAKRSGTKKAAKKSAKKAPTKKARKAAKKR